MAAGEPAEPTINFQPIGWDELAKAFEDMPEHVYAAMNVSFRRMGQYLVPALKKHTPTGATRALRNKTVAQITGKGDDMQLAMRQSAWSKDYPYGVGVRLGTRPHMPPYRALIPWVKLKWGADDKEAPRKAWFLALHIKEHGTKPNAYHVETIEDGKDDLRGIMVEEIDKAMKRLGDIRGEA